MANNLTNKGQDVALWQSNPAGTGGTGGIAGIATKVKLYTSASDSSGFKAGVLGAGGFIEPSVANGYAPITFGFSAWVRSIVGGNVQIVLQPSGVDPSWTAVGGNIANIAGAFITDASNNVLAWWERSPSSAITLAPGDSLTLDDLTLKLI